MHAQKKLFDFFYELYTIANFYEKLIIKLSENRNDIVTFRRRFFKQ